MMRCGLVPFWAKDLKVGFRISTPNPRELKINRRSSGGAVSCLWSFYEWKKIATGKQPYAIALTDRGLMALAGLWGKLAFACGRVGTQLRHHHYNAERTLRRAPQPDAGGPAATGLAGMARRGTSRPSISKGPTRSPSGGGDDLLACEHPGRKREA